MHDVGIVDKVFAYDLCDWLCNQMESSYVAVCAVPSNCIYVATVLISLHVLSAAHACMLGTSQQPEPLPALLACSMARLCLLSIWSPHSPLIAVGCRWRASPCNQFPSTDGVQRGGCSFSPDEAESSAGQHSSTALAARPSSAIQVLLCTCVWYCHLVV